MNQFKSTLLLLIASMVIFSGCGSKASDEIDFGAVTNSVYKNDYFGLSVELPPDWSVQDEEARQKLMELGGQMVAGDDKNLKAALKASELTTVNLFAAFKYPLGTPVPSNPSIMSVAEKVSHMPGITTGKDYLYHSKKALEMSQMQVSFPKEFSSVSLGGREFDVMHVDMSVPGTTIRQEYHVAVMKDYALAFIVSYTGQDEASSLKRILETISFD